MTFASYITILRIVLVIPIIYLMGMSSSFSNYLALTLFLIAGITDYIDGFIARKTKTETSLGALLDLLADKLLVCVVLIWLVFLINSIYLILPVILIISREIVISSLRQFVVERVGNNPIPVSLVGKSKTTIQFLAISVLIISPEFGSTIELIGLFLTWLAGFISIYSLIDYIKSYKVFF